MAPNRSTIGLSVLGYAVGAYRTGRVARLTGAGRAATLSFVVGLPGPWSPKTEAIQR